MRILYRHFGMNKANHKFFRIETVAGEAATGQMNTKSIKVFNVEK